MTSDRTLQRRWPESLIQQVATHNFVLVVGAGASLGCSNSIGARPLSWPDLIKQLNAKFGSGSTKAAVTKLLQHNQFLEAAEVLKAHARATSKEQDFLDAIVLLTDGGPSQDRQFQPGKLQDTLLRLDPYVFVTTNYDRILERACNSGFNVHHSDFDQLAQDVRTGTPLILKIHGSADRKKGMVLTRSDYMRLRREATTALEVLQALLLTRTTLFVGYSFSDPDIQLLLENAVGARGGPAAHYLLTSDSTPTHQREVLKHSYGTTLVTYKGADYAEMARMLELLADAVEAVRTA